MKKNLILTAFLIIKLIPISAVYSEQNSSREKYQESINNIMPLLENEKYDVALSLSEPLSKEFPSYPEAFIISGDALFQLGSYEDAYKAYLHSLYIKTNSPIYDKAKETLKKIDNTKLITINLRRAINEKPNDFVLRNILASFYIELGLYEKAISESKEILKINPWDTEALINLALVYLIKKEPTESKKYLDISDSHNVQSDKLHFLKGYFLLKFESNYQDGENELINAIVANPFVSLYYYNLASLYMKLKYYNKASILLKQATEIDPTNIKLFVLLAKSHYLNNQINKSIETFERILNFAPTSPSGHLGLGKLYLKLNQYNKTLNYFQTALKFDGSIITLINIIEVYFQKYFYFILFICISCFVFIVYILRKYYAQSPKF